MKLNFPGVPVYMNGRNYFIPSLSTRQYQDNQQLLENLPDRAEGESPIGYGIKLHQLTMPLIGLAMRRNYPDVSDEQLADWIDGNTFMIAWQATQSASGMKPVTEGEDLPTAMEPTGTGSTAVLPQP